MARVKMKICMGRDPVLQKLRSARTLSSGWMRSLLSFVVLFCSCYSGCFRGILSILSILCTIRGQLCQRGRIVVLWTVFWLDF